MLDLIEQLTTRISNENEEAGLSPVSFRYGTMPELNVLADHLPDGLHVFHEGYFNTTPRIAGNGALLETHQLVLFLFAPASLSDLPEQKRECLTLLTPLYRRLFVLLDKAGTVAGASANMNFSINITDRNLSGIRLALSLTPEGSVVC
ncbi:hypothetical protein [Spirosoma luteum]|uniref:hypothetical protein n=1 Tax=Spirosoma luteum TaxID=431553 RepID=UPI0003673576|nr:hypothetical protein [Spirosoma luteum]